MQVITLLFMMKQMLRLLYCYVGQMSEAYIHTMLSRPTAASLKTLKSLERQLHADFL